MYDKFSKGETIKNGASIFSSFPASQDIELWKNDEQRRYEIFDRPVRNLFENYKETKEFLHYLQTTLKLGKNIDGTASENSVLSGCALESTTVNTKNYVTVTPGIFVANEKIYQIYPTTFVASRQLEKVANMLHSEDGLEYINITYDGTFSATIKVGNNVEHSISDVARGVTLISQIITYLNGKFTLDDPLNAISITVKPEDFQLEPCFETTALTKYIVFNTSTEKITFENATSGFELGTAANTTATQTAKTWDGFTTNSLKDNAITNTKLADMPFETLKGNDLASGNPKDLTKTEVVNMFELLTWDTPQSINTTKTFIVDQNILNDKSIVFEDDGATTGWNVKNNVSNSLSIINGSTSIITLEDDNDIAINSADFSLTSSTNTIGLTGNTKVTGNLNTTGNTDLDGTLNVVGDSSVTGINTITGLLNANGGIAVATNKFTVSDTGNTSIAGTLGVAGATTLNNTLTVNGTYATQLGGTLTVTGVSTLNGESTVNNDFYVNASESQKLQVLPLSGTTITGDTGLVLSGANGNVFHISAIEGNESLFYVDTDEAYSNVATSINNTLGVTGHSTLASLGVTGSATVGTTLGVTGHSTLNSLGVTGSATVGTTLGVTGKSTLNSLEVTNNTVVNGTLGVTLTSTFTGQITANGGITSPSTIITTGAGSISSASTITAGKNIISTTGDLILKKRSFLIGLGNPAGTTYDWSIGKTSTTEIGSLEIKNSGNPSNGTFSINNTGLVKALKFETNGTYTLNNLNVEKFNGHTITATNATSADATNTSMILWKPSDSSEIRKTTFTSLPIAKSIENGDSVNMNGLMPSGSLDRLTILEDIAGLTADGGINLIGTINNKEVDEGQGGGGNVTIYGSDINISDSIDTTIATRLSSNADELTRLAYQVPNNETYNATANQVIISRANNTPVWGNVSDNQLGTNTITKVSPDSSELSRTLLADEKPIALWNTDSKSLHRDNDVVFNTYDNTLTATNVSSRSSRTVKKDITTYTDSAFDTLNQIEVVSFHYIADETQSDKVGFIAEDSPELVAGINHDKMEIGNCIGLLIKAVQELKQENEELRKILNGYNA